jgi:hypothetical protein
MNSPTSGAPSLPPFGALVFYFLVITFLGIWPALTNGQPFFYPDTTAYVRGADLAISKGLGDRFSTDWDKDPRRIIFPKSATPASDQTAAAERKSARRVVLAGRSIIYGALLYLGAVIGGMWFSIIMQSLSAACLIFVFVVRTLGLDFRHFLISCAFLFTASPLPFFASFLMPDVFAGFLILAFAILATSWHRLSRVELVFLSAVLLFAVLAHFTHLLLLISLTALTAGYVWVRADRSPLVTIRGLIALASACVVLAVLWEVTFSFAVNRAFGSPPIRPPFIMAKLVSLVGEPAVARVCVDHDFVVCRFQSRFPIDNDSFLWSEDERAGVFSVVDVPTKRLLCDEQLRFALAIVPPNLGRIVSGELLDALRQLDHIGLSDYAYSPAELNFFRDRLPSRDFDWMLSTVAARSDAYETFGRTVLFVTGIAAAVITTLLLLGVRSWRTAQGAIGLEQRRIWCAATCLQLAGIILNAMICGAFSAVHDRYESRVIWLIQLSAVTGIFVMSRTGGTPGWVLEVMSRLGGHKIGHTDNDVPELPVAKDVTSAVQ